MKQQQAKKETPRTNDKMKTVAFRCKSALHKQCHAKGRGSPWLRRVVERAISEEKNQ